MTAEHPHILLIDDSPSNIEVLAAVLEDRYELSFATSGEEALALVDGATGAGRPPDLILLDLLMPGMDGCEVCAALKANAATRDIPVIIVTASADVASETRALAAGAVDFITKPFGREVVLARVRVHLDLVRQRLELEELNRRMAKSLVEIEEANARLRQLAHHDPLTGLPNRTLFFDRVVMALALAQRNGTRVALMFIDLDRFKPVNDVHGHAVGDALLIEATTRMAACVRASDTVGRIGGDEFIVLLQDVGSEQEAVAVGEKIRRTLAEPFAIGGRVLGISASIGIALAPDHGTDEIELARSADAAMYVAKAAGRDCVRVYRAEAQASLAAA